MKLLTPLAMNPVTQIATAGALLLCLYGMALPVPGSRTETGSSTLECLTLADQVSGSSSIPVVDVLEVLERCSALLPADAELLADLGAAYEAAGRADAAESAYRRALGIDPDFAEVRRRLAILLERRGEADEARRQIEAALRVQPNREDLVTWLRR